MSVLSAVPKGFVIIMQVSLVALLFLAAVPIAVGGMDVTFAGRDVTCTGDAIRVEVNGDVVTSGLYFEITGFGYDASVSSGGRTVPLFTAAGVTIPKDGITPVTVGADIPMTVLAMMILYSASSGGDDVVMTFTVRGSTLSGMISAAVSVSGTVISVDTGSADASGIINELTAEITAAGNDLTDAAYGAGTDTGAGDGSRTITITVGDPAHWISCIITITPVPVGRYTIGLDITCSDPSFADSIAGIPIDADGKVDVSCNGTVTKQGREQLDLIADALMNGGL